jgi:nitroreductase
MAGRVRLPSRRRVGVDDGLLVERFLARVSPVDDTEAAHGSDRSAEARRILPRASRYGASFIDAVTGFRIEAHNPHLRPDRWLAYMAGIDASYRAEGIEGALDPVGLRPASLPSLFFVAIDASGEVVGGIRCHGPLLSVADARVMDELAAHPRIDLLSDLLAARIPYGLVEIKGAWIAKEYQLTGLRNSLARCCAHAMSWFEVENAVAASSRQLARLWRTTGARTLDDLVAIPYPDERFATVVLWWQRDELAAATAPKQAALIQTEARTLFSRQETAVVNDVRVRAGRALWRAEVLDDELSEDRAALDHLRADGAVEILDHLDAQRDGLMALRPELPAELLSERPRWAYYPWRRALVRLLGPNGFRALRLDRNRNKITREEQSRLAQLRVGIVGLSVGHAVAHILALEGICGELRLADFDVVELPNLNRLPVTLLDLGLNKAIVAARRVAEFDPYLPVDVFTDGLVDANVEAFVAGLDLLVDECDSLDVKVRLREVARASRIPVLMETSDRGLLDVERFDLEPDRPIFHGLLGDVDSGDLAGLSTHDKVPHVLRLLEPAQLSTRMAASMAEIDETVTTWPQLGGDVALGAASVAAAVRRLWTGGELRSGRVRVDLDARLDQLREPDELVVDIREIPPETPPMPPDDPHLSVAFAANLAPSGGNSQPWSFRTDDGQLRILLDGSRTSSMDVRFRGSYVAIGAALFNARVAAAAHGVLGGVEYFPNGEDADPVAALTFGRDADPALAAQYAGMLARGTNRRTGRPGAIGPDLVATLQELVAEEGARLTVLTDREALEDYADILGESDRIRYLSPILHGELMSELRWPGRDPLETGIDVRTLELDAADLSKLAVAQRSDVMATLASWDGGRALGAVTRDRVRSSSALAVVSISAARPGSYVVGGSAVERLWLAAEAAGLAVQPVSPVFVFAVEPDDFSGLVPDAYVPRLRALEARLRSLAGLAAGEALALVLRLSHAPPASTRSLRLGLDAYLGAGVDPGDLATAGVEAAR